MKIYRAKKASFALLAGVVFFLLSGSIFGQNMFRKVNDFDGDGKADYVVTRNVGTSKYWYVWKSASGPDVFQFGLDTDVETAGDWDGDGKTDYSVYRKVNYTGNSNNFHDFWIYGSQTNTVLGRELTTPMHMNGMPFPQDYNNDGKMEAAIVITNDTDRPEPYINISDISTRLKSYTTGTTPVRVGDMTGDGISDVVFYNSSNVVTTKNYATENSQSIQFGTTGDQYIPADFDGDGKGDLTVFRESNGSWWWLRSSDNVVNAVQFGQVGDKPVPADYDGDGKTDLAIWRPGVSQSYYWVYGSLGNVWTVPFGIGTDTVIRY